MYKFSVSFSNSRACFDFFFSFSNSSDGDQNQREVHSCKKAAIFLMESQLNLRIAPSYITADPENCNFLHTG